MLQKTLKKYLKANTIIVSFPNLYFTGYFPQAFFFRNKEGKKIEDPFPYHDINIYNAWKKGLPIEEVEKFFFDPNFYSEDFIQENISKSLEELRWRE